VSKYKLTGKKEEEKKPEIPTSYPKMSPLDAATIHVMITECYLSIKAIGRCINGESSTGHFEICPVCGYAYYLYCMYIAQGLRVIIFCY
jgi:hypothetical protein